MKENGLKYDIVTGDLIMDRKPKKGWRDVTINEYFDLCERLEETEKLENQDYLRAVIRVSFANGLLEEEVWNLSINQFRNLQVEAMWMDRFDIAENVKFKTINIDGASYTVDTNLQNFTVAQYIDFQTFYKKFKSDKRVMGNLLACFIIPKGKQYADGYNIQNVVRAINEHLDIMTANEILFFFLKSYLISIRVTANYFNWMMKRVKRKIKDKAKMAELEADWERMKKTTLDGLRLLITSGN